MADITVITSNPFLALLKNKSLSNPEFWKKIQQLVHVLMGLVPFLRFIFPQYAILLDPAFLASAEAALGTLAAYFTTATSGKVGF